jgi:hypothetical protein
MLINTDFLGHTESGAPAPFFFGQKVSQSFDLQLSEEFQGFTE